MKNLMKHLLNNPVMNDTRWSINKKVKQRTNLRNDNKSIGPKWHLFCYQHRTPKGFTYNRPTYDGKGQAKCFSSRSLLRLSTLSNKCVTYQFRMVLVRRPKNWAWACLYCLPTRQTRKPMVIILSLVHGVTLSSVYGITLSLVHGVTLPLVHETTLPEVRIKPTKAVTSLRVNIKPTRTTTSTFRAHQKVYRVFKTPKKLRLTWPCGSHCN